VPAADLSEQISTAGYEASGTGNMKLALNGAVTIGTLDGANIEILEEVGQENIFIFGLTADEVHAIQQQSAYRPADHYNRDKRIERAVNAFRSGLFSPNEPGNFSWIFDMVMTPSDEHLHMADLSTYLDAHDKVTETFKQADAWARMAILNVAGMGRFSSDRTVIEYAREVWKIHPR